MSVNERLASSRWRLWFVGLALGLLAVIVCGRLIWLHVLETRNLRDIGDEITIRYQKIPAYRGMITDQFAQPLAISTPVAAVRRVPINSVVIPLGMRYSRRFWIFMQIGCVIV